MKKVILSCVLLISGLAGFSQAPVITGVDKSSAYTLGKIVITGTGFNADPANMAVWFGGAEGQVITASAGLLEVKIPTMAHADNITVINKVTKKSAKSDLKFFSNFRGDTFDPTLLKQSFVKLESNVNELYDLCECDVNRDGKADIAVTVYDNIQSNSVKLWLNSSTPGNATTFALDIINFNIALTHPAGDIKCGDLNGDNWPELVITAAGPGGVDPDKIFIVPNNIATTGKMGSPILLVLDQATTALEQIVIRDLNYDGLPDLVVSNSKSNIVNIFKNTSAGAISFDPTPVKVTLGGKSFGLEVQDLNGDNRPEIIVTGDNPAIAGTSDVNILQNLSTQTKIDFQVINESFNLETLVKNITTADFDGDGLLDIVTSSNFDNQIFVSLNKSVGDVIHFAAKVPFPASSPWGMDVGDMNGDGKIDLVVSNLENNGFDIYVNTSSPGTVSFSRNAVVATAKTRNMLVNDFDGDGKPDIAFTSIVSTSSTGFEVWRNGNCHLPLILGDTPQKICPGQIIDISAIPSPGSQFAWSLGGVTVKTGVDPFIGVDNVGTLSLIVTQEAGYCATPSSNQLVFNSGAGAVPGAPTASNDGPVCLGGTINLKSTIDPAIVGATYEWTYPSGEISTQPNPVITNATLDHAGIYSLTIKAGDCLSSTVTTGVEVYSFPTLYIESGATGLLCEGQSTSLSLPPIAGLTYQWQKGGVDTPTTGNTYTVSSGGTYTVKVSSASPVCTIITDPFELQTAAVPVAAFTTDKNSYCAGENSIFADNSTIADTVANNIKVLYTWMMGDGNTLTGSGVQHQYQSVGVFSTSLTVSYEGITGCSSTTAPKDITITDAIPPVITASTDAICPGDSVTLSITDVYKTITWNTGDTTSQITKNVDNTYFVNTTDANGCPGYDEFIVIGKQPANLVVPNDTTIHQGDSVILLASGSSDYRWYPSRSLDDSLSAAPVARPDSTTLYRVIGTSLDGCTDTLSVLVTVLYEIGIFPRKAFSPNSDGIDDAWEIGGIDQFSDCILRVFDRRGRIVYESEGTYQPWDGTYNGSEVPVDVYYYVISCPTSDLPPKKGSVFVAR